MGIAQQAVEQRNEEVKKLLQPSAGTAAAMASQQVLEQHSERMRKLSQPSAGTAAAMASQQVLEQHSERMRKLSQPSAGIAAAMASQRALGQHSERMKKLLQPSAGTAAAMASQRALGQHSERMKKLLQPSAGTAAAMASQRALEQHSERMKKLLQPSAGAAATAYAATERLSYGLSNLQALENTHFSASQISKVIRLPLKLDILKEKNPESRIAKHKPSHKDIRQDAGQQWRKVESTPEIILLLNQFSPLLARLYMGAIRALHSNNPDKARHVLISLRELWSNVLRVLSPDDSVMTCIEKGFFKEDDLLHKGRPTRRAKVLYIYRGVYNGPLREVARRDSKLLAAVFDLLNRIHKANIDLSDNELQALIWKSEAELLYLLKLTERN